MSNQTIGDLSLNGNLKIDGQFTSITSNANTAAAVAVSSVTTNSSIPTEEVVIRSMSHNNSPTRIMCCKHKH